MGKHEFLTPKAIANRIKAKGLQKLRWYCQMCQKQCRDENGFKCHCESESHQRQMSLFADRPDSFLDYFSQEFLDGFLELLKRRFGKSRIHANVIYNEYINDRNHTHMNATKWETLTNFVKWLGKEGYAVVEETPKGWYMTYIDRDPLEIAKQEAAARREKATLDEEERQKRLIQRQMEEAAAREPDRNQTEFTELKRDEASAPITLSLSVTASTSSSVAPKLEPKPALATVFSIGGGTSKSSAEAKGKSSTATSSTSQSESSKSSDKKRKLSALDEIMEDNEKKKESMKRKDHWLTSNIVVKVLTKALANGKYYKLKGVVEKVEDLYLGHVRMNETGHLIKIDQGELETVLPAIGGRVRFVNGAYRGETGQLQSIDVNKFTANVKIDKGPLNGRVVTTIYEDISKLAS